MGSEIGVHWVVCWEMSNKFKVSKLHTTQRQSKARTIAVRKSSSGMSSQASLPASIFVLHICIQICPTCSKLCAILPLRIPQPKKEHFVKKKKWCQKNRRLTKAVIVVQPGRRKGGWGGGGAPKQINSESEAKWNLLMPIMKQSFQQSMKWQFHRGQATTGRDKTVLLPYRGQ